MKVFLWEYGKYFSNIVLWDGENTYWIEEMRPSGGYKNLMNEVDAIDDRQRWTYIGEL